jgi:hypothetical protein
MGVRILVGHEQGEHTLAEDKAVLFDSVTGWAFGPLFTESEDGEMSAEEQADVFLKWLEVNDHKDPRNMTRQELEQLHSKWLGLQRVA